ncbi:MAG TPA: hypothetical protein VFU09_02770, partial [Candidatus Udaeobacter sp.]|nr:hypothetical protein [Candidatus Udaeobacter sp.]
MSWVTERQYAINTRNLPFADGFIRGIAHRLPVITGGMGRMDHYRVLLRRAIRFLNEGRLDSLPVRYQAWALAFAGADLLASALPNIFAVNVRFTKAGTNASMKRFSRPGTILDRFSRSALRPSDT